MLQQLFSFKGRVNRAKFWAFYIGGTLLVSVLVAALMAANAALSHNEPQLELLNAQWPQTPLGWATELPMAVLSSAFFYAMIGMIVKRLHDRNKSAWWLILYWGPAVAFFALLYGLGFGAMGKFPMPGALLNGLFFVVWLIGAWYLVEILFLPGTRGDNLFGPDPRAKIASN